MPKMITMEMMQLKKAPVRTESLEQVPVKKTLKETDEQIKSRLRERFQVLDDMTRAVKKGQVRAMIVSGPPGVGKSFGVEAVLSKHDTMANIAGNEKLKKYEVVKGAMSALVSTRNCLSLVAQRISLCSMTVIVYC